MRILTRYFLKLHLGPFIFSLIVLTSLLFINAVARRFEDLAGKGLPSDIIFEVYLYSFPHILALTLPMAVLVAVLYAFSQLTADNEITALKASGVNMRRLLVPLVIAGVVLAGFMVWFNDRLLPETNHRLKILLIDVARKSPVFNLKEQVINNVRTEDMRTRFFLQAERIDPATNLLRNVVIYDMSIPGRDRTVYADSGRMAFNRAQTDLFLTLYNGWIHQLRDQEPGQFQRVFFKQQMLELEGIGNQLERSADDEYRSDREMSLSMLKAQVDSARMDLADIQREALKYSTIAVQEATQWRAGMMGEAAPRRAAVELRMLQAREESARHRVDQYQVEWHKKFAIPFACIVFVILGAPLAVRFPRGGVGMVIAVSLGIFGIYYMSLIGGESLGDRGTLSPFWGPWAPNLLFFTISLWGLARIGRETSTARTGGGWSELWLAMREFMRFRRRRRP
jgi:lipopolysaccharide export system permease protein